MCFSPPKTCLLSVLCEHCLILPVVCIEVEDALSAAGGPLGWHGDEAVEECLEPCSRVHAEASQGLVLEQPAVEVEDDGRQEHEGGVLPHLGLGQAVPSEVVVELVDVPLLGTPLVVALDHAALAALVVVGQDGAVGVSVELEDILLGTLGLGRALHDQPAVGCVVAEGGERHAGGLGGDASDLGPAPHLRALQLLAQGGRHLGADEDVAAVLQQQPDHLAAARAAVHAGVTDADALLGQVEDDAQQRVLLAELDRRVAVPVLHADDDLIARDDVGQDGDARAVAAHALVGPLGIPLLGLAELVVKVQVVLPPRNELAAAHRQPHRQAIQPLGRVEAVGATRCAGVNRVRLRQFGDAAQHRVGAAQPQAGGIADALTAVVQVFRAVATAQEIAHHRHHDLAVLVAHKAATQAQMAVYLSSKMALELAYGEINTAIGHDFLGFYYYFCHV